MIFEEDFTVQAPTVSETNQECQTVNLFENVIPAVKNDDTLSPSKKNIVLAASLNEMHYTLQYRTDLWLMRTYRPVFS